MKNLLPKYRKGREMGYMYIVYDKNENFIFQSQSKLECSKIMNLSISGVDSAIKRKSYTHKKKYRIERIRINRNEW